MKNTTSMPMLHLGIKEETPLKKNYLAPNITMVEFAVEVGEMMSNQSVNIWGSDWRSAGSATDGTESYEMNNSQGSGFFD